jgi:hypothetical protein
MDDSNIKRCVRCGAWTMLEEKCDTCLRGIVFGVFSPNGGLTMVFRTKLQAQRTVAILEGSQGTGWYIEEVREAEIKWDRSTPRLRK